MSFYGLIGGKEWNGSDWDAVIWRKVPISGSIEEVHRITGSGGTDRAFTRIRKSGDIYVAVGGQQQIISGEANYGDEGIAAWIDTSDPSGSWTTLNINGGGGCNNIWDGIPRSDGTFWLYCDASSDKAVWEFDPSDDSFTKIEDMGSLNGGGVIFKTDDDLVFANDFKPEIKRWNGTSWNSYGPETAYETRIGDIYDENFAVWGGLNGRVWYWNGGVVTQYAPSPDGAQNKETRCLKILDDTEVWQVDNHQGDVWQYVSGSGWNEIGSCNSSLCRSYTFSKDKSYMLLADDEYGYKESETTGSTWSTTDPGGKYYATEIFYQGETSIAGNGTTIPSGDTTPDVSDDTDFGSIAAGSSKDVTYTITNSDDDGYLFLTGSVTLEDTTYFSILTQPADTVSPTGSTTFSIRFSPAVDGVFQTTASVPSTDAASPYTFVIEATSINPDILVEGNGIYIPDGDTTPITADGTDFGTRTREYDKTQEFVIANSGSGELFLTGTVTVDDETYFSVSAQPGTSSVPPSGSTTFSIRFEPSTVGTFQTTASIPSSDPDEHPYTFVVQGTANAPEMVLEGNDLNIENGDTSPRLEDGTLYYARVVSSSANSTFLIANSGSGDLLLTSSVTVNNENFTVHAQPGTSALVEDESTTFVIRFTPLSKGIHTGSISIINNDADENPFTFKVQGEGFLVGNKPFIGSDHLFNHYVYLPKEHEDLAGEVKAQVPFALANRGRIYRKMTSSAG